MERHARRSKDGSEDEMPNLRGLWWTEEKGGGRRFADRGGGKTAGGEGAGCPTDSVIKFNNLSERMPSRGVKVN